MQIRSILHKLITHRSCKYKYSHEIYLKKRKKLRKKRNGNNVKKEKKTKIEQHSKTNSFNVNKREKRIKYANAKAYTDTYN